MTKRTRVDTRGGRPRRDGRPEPSRTVPHAGRPAPEPTGTAPVRRAGVPSRRFDVSGPVTAYDDPHPGRERVQVRPVDATDDGGAWRGQWRPERPVTPDLRPDGTVAHPYGRGRTRGVGRAGRARAERRHDAAAAASRLDAVRRAALMRDERRTRDATPSRAPRVRVRRRRR